MTNSILASLTSKPVVSFINELNGLPMWTSAKSVRIEIQSNSDNSDVPLSSIQVADGAVSGTTSSGASVSNDAVTSALLATDIAVAKIMRPTHLRAIILTDNLSLVENILSSHEDNSLTIQITSKSIISVHMGMTSVELDQSSDNLSSQRVTITFEQTLVGAINPFAPAQAADASNFGLSLQTPPTVSSTLSTVQNKVGTIVNNTGTAVTALYNRFATSIGL